MDSPLHEAAEQENHEPKRWTVEHFRKLFQNTDSRAAPRWNKGIDTGEHFTLTYLPEALSRGKLNKAVGEDLLSFELIKALCEDPTTGQAFLSWMERIRCGEEVPEEWLRTVVTVTAGRVMDNIVETLVDRSPHEHRVDRGPAHVPGEDQPRHGESGQESQETPANADSGRQFE